jgi:hypothetical protein
MFTVIVAARGPSWNHGGWLDIVVVGVIAGIIIVRHLKSLLRVVRGQELGLKTKGTGDVQPDTASGAIDDGR